MQNQSDDMKIAEIIRPTKHTNPKKLQNGEFLVVYDKKKRQARGAPSLVEHLLPFGKGQWDYFIVKNKLIPSNIKGATFSWTEGITNVDLDFVGNFEVRINSQEQAERLVSVINKPGELYSSLLEVINAYVYREMSAIHERCVQNSTDLMQFFSADGIADGSSEKFNQSVSIGVQSHLGIEEFRIGLQLTNKPQFQIDVNHTSWFKVPESSESDKMNSHALLKLSDYQRFKRSGLKDEDQIRTAVIQSIDDAIQEHLFNKSLYEIAANFDNVNSDKDCGESYRALIRQRVEKDVEAIGYSLDMLQTFPELPILDLVDGLRVDMVSSDNELVTKHSTGNVKLSVSLEAKVNDFRLLRNLIKPDDKDIKGIIESTIRQICIDDIKQIERRDFNLNFEEKVAKKLRESIQNQFAERYGLNTSNIFIHAMQTEDGERFKNIVGEDRDIELKVRPVANSGKADDIEIEITFEVVAIDPNRWELFESKDYGFKKDSFKLTPSVIEEIKTASNSEPDSESFEKARKKWAIDQELTAIGKRITKNLESRFAQIAHFDEYTRDRSNYKDILEAANEQSKKIINDEFGLIVELRSFNRKLSKTEQARQVAEQSVIGNQQVLVDGRRNLLSKKIEGDELRLQALQSELEKLDKDEFLGDEATSKRKAEILAEIEKITGAFGDDPYHLLDSMTPTPPQERPNASNAGLEDLIDSYTQETQPDSDNKI